MNRISKDDPRVTAYALGELEGDELALVAAAVQADAELQAVVAEIRATAGALEQALAGEPAPELPARINPGFCLAHSRVASSMICRLSTPF